MKKALIWVLVLMMGCSLSAMALEMPEDGILKLDAYGTQMDLDGDGENEQISLALEVMEDEERYTLTVNDASFEGYGWCLTGDLYAVQMDETICLAVPEYGMSDDHYSYMFVYRNGKLQAAGGIPALPDEMETNMTGVTAMVRGGTLQTWFRPGEFVLAIGGYFHEETYEYTEFAPVITEVPRGYYPVGTVVRVKQDITLQVSVTNPEAALTLKAGDMAVISATDDHEWLYIATLEEFEYGEYGAGWAHMTDQFYVDTDAGAMFSSEVFEGLLFAD